METSNIIALALGGTGFIVSVVGFSIRYPLFSHANLF